MEGKLLKMEIFHIFVKYFAKQISEIKKMLCDGIVVSGKYN